MEILAPAGSRESLEAAVRSGANAVYLGASGFNARRNADNFDNFALEDAVSYCHGRHVSVYVTLNTLIFDSEREAFLSCLRDVLRAGPDRLIVQDLGALHLIRSVCPEIPVCASTQMAIHNIGGVHALEKLGITQAVLARELSLEEIKKIRSQTDIRLECFVHGAHCMSVSGMCYFSSALGERSGNRGLCAQPCRLDFQCGGRPFALSLKDLSFVNHVRELQEAGVTALKIEGRMKRPEYVAAAVTAVREALEGKIPDMDGLRKVFSRSGFTDGYLTGKRNAAMFGVRSEADMQASKAILGEMASLYRREFQGTGVSFSFSGAHEGLSLTASDEKSTVRLTLPAEEKDTGVLTKDMAEKALKKTGGTPFAVKELSVSLEEGLRIPSATVGELRRQALDLLLQKNSRGLAYSAMPYSPAVKERIPASTQKIRLRFASFAQFFKPDTAEMLIFPVEVIKEHPELLSLPCPVAAELPAVIWPGSEDRVVYEIAALKEKGLKDVVAGNIGVISPMLSLGMRVHGDAQLNITNTDALAAYADAGLCDAVLSFELTVKQAASVYNTVPCGIYTYGRLPLMFFRSCPARTEKGCGECKGVREVKDKRAAFPLLCHNRQYSVMHNSVPLYLGDIPHNGTEFACLYFSNETGEEACSVYKKYLSGQPLRSDCFTRGHAIKPVK